MKLVIKRQLRLHGATLTGVVAEVGEELTPEELGHRFKDICLQVNFVGVVAEEPKFKPQRKPLLQENKALKPQENKAD